MPIYGPLRAFVEPKEFNSAAHFRYVFLYSKGYQEFEMAESSVVTKTKGLMYYTDLLGRKEIWDHLDFVVPSQASSISLRIVYHCMRHDCQPFCLAEFLFYILLFGSS